jgi:hypothetical protein
MLVFPTMSSPVESRVLREWLVHGPTSWLVAPVSALGKSRVGCSMPDLQHVDILASQTLGEKRKSHAGEGFNIYFNRWTSPKHSHTAIFDKYQLQVQNE